MNWFRDFLEWYHTYPYETDQRGLDALTFYNSTLKVSYQPRKTNMTLANPSYLDELRSFAFMKHGAEWGDCDVDAVDYKEMELEVPSDQYIGEMMIKKAKYQVVTKDKRDATSPMVVEGR